jgi:hypothetical protein
MKTRSLFALFLLFFCVLPVLYAEEEQVPSTPLAPTSGIPKFETDDQISEAMERVKNINIKRYKSLKKLKEQNIQKFIIALSQFFYENDPTLLRQKQRSLIQNNGQLKTKLQTLSEKLSLEQDINTKKQIIDDIKQTAEKLIQTTLDQQELLLTMKRQEIALMETQLEIQKENKKETVQALVDYTIPKTSASF